jgi:hypothetical protein
MKDVHFVLEFTTHVLANGMGPDDKRDHFQRDSHNDLIWQQSWWYSAFTRAIELAHLRRIKAADIHMNLAVKATTATYRRRYGDEKYRTHEAIMPGSKVEFEAVVADHVTKSNLEAILDKMGKFVGLSPYGYRLGFGKFNVVSVEVASSDSETSDSGSDQKPAAPQEGIRG